LIDYSASNTRQAGVTKRESIMLPVIGMVFTIVLTGSAFGIIVETNEAFINQHRGLRSDLGSQPGME
jgi:hypothetical protein